MENQGKQAAAEGENMSTLRPKCNVPDAPVTYSNCETTENTCQGIPTCQQQTCFGTCYEATCIWYETCSSTCESTCQSTCQGTCPWVQGDCGYFGDYNYDWTPWGNRWVKLFDEGVNKLNETDFNAWGDYAMQSVRFMPLVLKAHAQRKSANKWLHVYGEKNFIQFDMIMTVNINLNDEHY